MYDIIIIGGGPAGVSAAINAKILNKNYLWLVSSESSEKVERAELIQNYPALPDITGSELSAAFLRHAEHLGLEKTRALVTGVYPEDDGFSVLAGSDVYEGRTVILCTGVQAVKPVKGEEEFLGRGVSYCATCDGFLYKGKKIAVVCYEKSLEHEAEYLCDLAKEVILVPLYKGCEIKKDNAEIIILPPVEFAGENRVNSIIFKGQSRDIDGVFVLRSSLSPTTLLHGLELDGGHIKVDRSMRTNIEGVFAAGDCVGRPYQYVKSAGEGNIAAHSAVDYLAAAKNK